jgi:hypothetical protein
VGPSSPCRFSFSFFLFLSFFLAFSFSSPSSFFSPVRPLPCPTILISNCNYKVGRSLTNSHTCEHLLVALKIPATHPANDPIPWDTHPTLQSLRKGIDTDVVVAEVRETSRKPDEVYGVIERYVPLPLLHFLRLYLLFLSSFPPERNLIRDGRKTADIRLAPHGRKLELFGRKHNTRPGWLTLGNQCESTPPWYRKRGVG